MRRPRSLGTRALCAAALAVLAAGCGGARPTAARPLRAVDVVGEYDIIAVGDQLLPVRIFRNTVYGGRLRLARDRRYTWIQREEVCAPASCYMRTDTARGAWALRPDGRLALGSDRRDEATSPPAEVDGRQIRIRWRDAGDGRTLGPVFERRER